MMPVPNNGEVSLPCSTLHSEEPTRLDSLSSSSASMGGKTAGRRRTGRVGAVVTVERRDGPASLEHADIMGDTLSAREDAMKNVGSKSHQAASGRLGGVGVIGRDNAGCKSTEKIETMQSVR